MRDIDKIHDKVEKRKRQLQELFTKDEENYDLWAGKEQSFDTHKMAINITGTEMTALALRVQASLNRSRLDVHVLPPTPLSNPDAVTTANQEERMYYHGFEMADERLSNIGDASLLSSATWQAVVLGRIAVRVCVYRKGDKLIWDYLPLNPRFLTFSFDSEGLAWACYETFRSPASIEAEYGKEVTEDLEGKGVSVSDYWDREHNVRYLTKGKEQLGKAWKHPFGETPIIIQPVTLGPKAITSEGTDVTAWGQSIFDHVKVPFRNLNLLRSITAHHAHLLAKAPIEAIRREGSDERVEEQELSFYPNAIINHTDAVTLKSMEIKDIPQSVLTMMGDISTGIQRATYTELSPDKPAHSGAALRILGQDKMDVETPRVDSLNKMFTRICRASKRQIVSQKLTIPVQTVVNGEYQTYDMKPNLLDNDFYVNATLIRQDVYDEEARLQRAQMLMQLRLKSRESVMEQEMDEPDVPAEILKMDMEEVEAEIPEMKLKKLIKTYLELEMFEEAEMMKEQLGMLEIQKQQMLQGMMQGGAPGGAPGGVPTGTPPPQGAP